MDMYSMVRVIIVQGPSTFLGAGFRLYQEKGTAIIRSWIYPELGAAVSGILLEGNGNLALEA
jgi:hypothetical protein